MKNKYGFTLIECLVVIAIISVLSSILLVSTVKVKIKTQGIQCMNNGRQLSLGWFMYAHDNNNKIVYASDDGNGVTYNPKNKYAWTLSHMDFDPNNTANWDINADITKGPLWMYLKNSNIYKCPSDHSYVTVNGEQKPRVRTISMNLFLGGFAGDDGGSFFLKDYQIYLSLYDISGNNSPSPSKTFLFLDEREDVLNWGNFQVYMNGYNVPNGEQLYGFFQDIPGMYHNNSCGFSFCDGHSEIHKWKDSRTIPPIQSQIQTIGFLESPYNADVAWLQDHATRRK